MKFVVGTSPTLLTTDELVQCRTRTRQAIKVLENAAPRTNAEDVELRALRVYLRQLMQEAGKRFIQERLF